MDGHWYIGHDFWKKLLTNTIPKPSFDSRYGHTEIIVDVNPCHVVVVVTY